MLYVLIRSIVCDQIYTVHIVRPKGIDRLLKTCCLAPYSPLGGTLERLVMILISALYNSDYPRYSRVAVDRSPLDCPMSVKTGAKIPYSVCISSLFLQQIRRNIWVIQFQCILVILRLDRTLIQASISRFLPIKNIRTALPFDCHSLYSPHFPKTLYSNLSLRRRSLVLPIVYTNSNCIPRPKASFFIFYKFHPALITFAAMSLPPVYIVSAARTPVGSFLG